EAVLVDLGDVAGAEPPVFVEHLPGPFVILEVTREDGRAADEQLAVIVEAELGAGQRRTDRAEPVAAEPVDRRRRRALGEAVALEDRDAERVEELRDVLREWRAAGDGETKPSA